VPRRRWSRWLWSSKSAARLTERSQRIRGCIRQQHARPSCSRRELRIPAIWDVDFLRANACVTFTFRVLRRRSRTCGRPGAPERHREPQRRTTRAVSARQRIRDDRRRRSEGIGLMVLFPVFDGFELVANPVGRARRGCGPDPRAATRPLPTAVEVERDSRAAHGRVALLTKVHPAAVDGVSARASIGRA
jgi:hypothetical protein